MSERLDPLRGPHKRKIAYEEVSCANYDENMHVTVKEGTVTITYRAAEQMIMRDFSKPPITLKLSEYEVDELVEMLALSQAKLRER